MTKNPKGRAASTTRTPLDNPPLSAPKTKRGNSGWGPVATEPMFTEVPPTAPVAAEATATSQPKRRHRKFKHIVERHPGPDGKRGFTFRDLCPVLHVAAESLRAALIDPGRLTVNSIVALADLMEEDPQIVLSDILAEVRSNPAARKAAAAKARAGKKTTPAAEQPSEPEPEPVETKAPVKATKSKEPAPKSAAKTEGKAGTKKGNKK
ncbi:hypothetical protein [Hymenobacter sp. YC55]|uniref:hypothetical protein n=1 Tax=Hymenobacter sp. YC55 TaxID=3034019 RepID=UPI0023F9F38E|nr:hypothetical protein [Hymenobacter sp. YC55]MDF7815448.1 hypothetical protein [Hymenobacter sp. YC55]